MIHLQVALYTHCILVFFLLLQFYPSLPQSWAFRTGIGTDLRKIDIAWCYEAIGTNRTEALLGFYTFTGCDQTGRFCDKSKTFWWKKFYKADSDTLEALGKLGTILFFCLEGKNIWKGDRFA